MDFKTHMVEDIFLAYLAIDNDVKAKKFFFKIPKEKFNHLILKTIELKMGPKVEKFIKKYSEELKDDSLFKRLFKRNNHIKIKNLITLDTVSSISEFLEKNKTKYVFLKGVPLLLDFYNDISDRELKDIDILLEKRRHIFIQIFTTI